MTELDKITLKMALFALVSGLFGCVIGWLGGSIHTEKELNDMTQKTDMCVLLISSLLIV